MWLIVRVYILLLPTWFSCWTRSNSHCWK